jgi:hypothetical protein
MDVIRNPYSPGAGRPPPELAGRDQVRALVRVLIERTRLGQPAKSIIMVGLRGVGKTVLLNQMLFDAEATNTQTVYVEASESRSFPAMLAPQLRLALFRLGRIEAAKEAVVAGLCALADFVVGMKAKYVDIQVGLDYEPNRGLADEGDLAGNLAALLMRMGKAAEAANTVLAVFVDELQYVAEEELAALVAAQHCVSQLKLPITFIGAGLPQHRRRRVEYAKLYTERLECLKIGHLEPHQARLAFVNPAEAEGVTVDLEAANLLVQVTRGYPYFIQLWGSSVWDIAQNDHITLADIQNASVHVIAALNEGLFRVRFDRMTLAEQIYSRALASLGEGPYRSADIAKRLGKTSQSLKKVRRSLIDKGMIWSPSHGDTAFTVPMFDQYMCWVMPGERWRSEIS